MKEEEEEEDKEEEEEDEEGVQTCPYPAPAGTNGYNFSAVRVVPRTPLTFRSHFGFILAKRLLTILQEEDEEEDSSGIVFCSRLVRGGCHAPWFDRNHDSLHHCRDVYQ